MFSCFHFPAFSLNCLLARDGIAPEQAAVLLSQGEREKSSLLEVNEAARQHGLLPGLRTTRALARCADLLLMEPDEEAEIATRRELLAFIESLTPDFELTSPETFLLDLSSILYSSKNDWLRTSLDASKHLALPVQAALGSTPDLAHLTALSRHTAARPGHLPENFSPFALPLDELIKSGSFPLKDLEVLHLWGLHTLEDLAALPRQGLTERLGPDLARLHDILHEKSTRLLKLHQPLCVFQISHIFEPPVENHEPILFIARRLLQTLCNRLAHHQRAAAEMAFHLSFENGAGHTRTMEISEPTLSPDILLSSLHTHLENFSARAPINEFHLELIPTLPRHAQHQLFHRGIKDPHQFDDTLRRLSGIVGAHRLGIPQVANTHRPDILELHPLTPDFTKPTGIDHWPGSRLPMSRFRPPLTVHLATQKEEKFPRPLAILTGPHQGTVTTLRGPFPLSGSWWQHTWQQVEWDIELNRETLLQLSFTPPETWALTGIYG